MKFLIFDIFLIFPALKYGPLQSLSQIDSLVWSLYLSCLSICMPVCNLSMTNERMKVWIIISKHKQIELAKNDSGFTFLIEVHPGWSRLLFLYISCLSVCLCICISLHEEWENESKNIINSKHSIAILKVMCPDLQLEKHLRQNQMLL